MKRRSDEEISAPLYEYDAAVRSQYGCFAGVDEAGRGPLCGPVCVAACILDPENPVFGINDSKKLTEKKREALFDEIIEKALPYKIVFVNKPAHLIGRVLVHILLDGLILSCDLQKFLVDVLIIHLQNVGKPLGNRVPVLFLYVRRRNKDPIGRDVHGKGLHIPVVNCSPLGFYNIFLNQIV